MVEAKPKNWRWWIIVSALAIVVLILLGVALWAAISVLPPVLVERQLRSDISHTDRLKEIDTVRTSLLGPLATLIGAMAVLAGAGVAYLNFRGTLELNRRGQVTDRFTKAIEQIGQADEKKLNARIGGVYALEQIAKDSKDLHWPVIQTLTAYLREHSVEPLQPTAEQVKEGAVESRKETATPSRPSRADFLAVADVIRRRRWEWDPKAVIRRRSWEWDSSAGLDIEGTTGPEPLDLEGCNLRRAVLENAHLERADFQRAQLEEARFDSMGPTSAARSCAKQTSG